VNNDEILFGLSNRKAANGILEDERRSPTHARPAGARRQKPVWRGRVRHGVTRRSKARRGRRGKVFPAIGNSALQAHCSKMEDGMTISSLGFEIGTPGGNSGEFLSILKWNAQSGIFSRIDRVQGLEGWESVAIPIGPKEMKMKMDLENLEVGWLDFATGGAPHMSLVPLAALEAKTLAYPPQPTERHKKGCRLVVQLGQAIGGENRIRELATNSVTFLGGLDLLNMAYKEGRAAHPGMLPIVGLDAERPAIGVKTGSGSRSSTNYRPNFVILGWAARGELTPHPRASAPAAVAAAPAASVAATVRAPAPNGQRPATGSRPAAPPAPPVVTVADNDFG
jgi:hypothetical protein